MMTIQLPNDVERSIRAAVHIGRFASVEAAMIEAARLLIRELNQPPPVDAKGVGFIGALRDDADLLDQAVEHAMRLREGRASADAG